MFSSNLEIGSSEDQETDPEVMSATKKQVSKRSEGKKVGKKRGRPVKNKNEPIRVERVLRSHLQKYRNGMLIFYIIFDISIDDHVLR